MGQLEDKLNDILSSPEEMSRIMSLAESLSVSFGAAGAEDVPKNDDTSMAEKLSRAVGGMKDDYKMQLLTSLTHCIRGERRQDMERAVRLLRIYRIARSMMEDMGGEEHL